MATAIDVLAVMDADARAVACVIDECLSFAREASWRAHLAEHDKARAAVAETYAQRDALAASLAEMLELRQATQDGRVTEKLELDIVHDARAALARVGGGK